MYRNAKLAECSCMQKTVALRKRLMTLSLDKTTRMQMQNQTDPFCTPEHAESTRLTRSAKVHPLKGVRGLHPFRPLSRFEARKFKGVCLDLTQAPAKTGAGSRSKGWRGPFTLCDQQKRAFRKLPRL